MRQKRRTGKKLFGLILTFALVFSLMPGMTVCAVDATQAAENAYMKYYVSNKGFDVKGKSGGTELSTTYSDAGYLTKMQVGDRSEISFGSSDGSFAFGKEYTDDGVTAYIIGRLEGNKVHIDYHITNTSDAAKTVKIGSSADTQIGSNDNAPVSFDGDGLKMTDGTHAFELLPGGGGFTTRWFGEYGQAAANTFKNLDPSTGTFSGDSGIAWSWTVDLAPGASVTKTAIMTAGAVNAFSILYHANGGTGDMEPTVAVYDGVSSVNLRKNTFSKAGSVFKGWDTDPAGATVVYADEASLLIPNTDTNLYAVWSSADGNTEKEVVLDGAAVADNPVSSAEATNIDVLAAAQAEEGKDVKVTLDVEKKDPASVPAADKSAIDSRVSAAFSGTDPADIITAYLEIDVTKYIKDTGIASYPASGTAITDTGTPLEIRLHIGDAADMSPVVIRVHGGNAETFSKLAAKPAAPYTDGTYYVDTAAQDIYVYSRYFSSFAIAYTKNHAQISLPVSSSSPAPAAPAWKKLPATVFDGTNTAGGEAGLSVTAGSVPDITITPQVHADGTKAGGFLSLKIDDAFHGPNHYTLNGNVITIHPSILNMLGEGVHTIRVNYDNNTYTEVTLTVLGLTRPDNMTTVSAPQTSDVHTRTAVVSCAMLLLSMAGLYAVKRRYRHS